MSGLMQCPSCKENIDDDSRYCDQCGEQILICSSCGRPGKGKRCIFDGKEMVPAGSKPSQTEHLQQPVQADQQKQSIPPPPQTPAMPAAASGEKIKLSSQSLGIAIEASDGDILGRSKGAFAGILGRFSHISGTHCKLIKTAAGWSIEDMGSTNGTFYNNSRLAPNVPVPLQSGVNVKLADIELLITYGGGGGTVRI
jgi:hypothetical protein